MLVDRQVGSQGSDAGSITSRSDCRPRELRFRGASAAATPAFDYVLGDDKADLRELEDLATFGADDLASFETLATRRARWWGVDDHLVGICDLGQMLAGRTGLLALLATSSPPFGPRR